MFTNISWANYLLTISLLFAAYYSIIGIYFYFSDLKAILSGDKKIKFRSPAAIINHATEDFPPSDTSEKIASNGILPGGEFMKATDDTIEVESLIAKIKEAVAFNAAKQAIKQEFAFNLTLILKQFPAFKESPFQPAINELIISECEKLGYVPLSEEEVAQLWNIKA